MRGQTLEHPASFCHRACRSADAAQQDPFAYKESTIGTSLSVLENPSEYWLESLICRDSLEIPLLKQGIDDLKL